MKIPQPKGTKGSLKWIQYFVNEATSALDRDIIKAIGTHTSRINWLSPKKADNYAEYRDGDFLDLLGLGRFRDDLKSFWPNRGPQWDALGKLSENGPYLLIEAKANAAEIKSSCQAKAEKSISLIQKRLIETAQAFGCKFNSHYTQTYYQYANRLAHLLFLRNICNVDAYLVMVYFVNDPSHIPTSRDEWIEVLNTQKRRMGIEPSSLRGNVVEVFINVEG